MKREGLIAVLLILLVVISFSSCGNEWGSFEEEKFEVEGERLNRNDITLLEQKLDLFCDENDFSYMMTQTSKQSVVYEIEGSKKECSIIFIKESDNSFNINFLLTNNGVSMGECLKYTNEDYKMILSMLKMFSQNEVSKDFLDLFFEEARNKQWQSNNDEQLMSQDKGICMTYNLLYEEDYKVTETLLIVTECSL